ncbi:hypothetical protein JWS13_12645 [Rhodococcus pseudokoreensis]|uniref:SCP2 domain-containing protein n=1 Tax=Rhodococcus pseudokoreensis TaxID=2811421 RepID=A0A974ZT92_9NOCA|nr:MULTISPECIES: hypothetical protein [Rhodococcus]OUS81340.1 hypothetical protein CA951_41535 [Rhodococcus sp. NCIMB 12038]QSE89409.1 hypothetical protein JWS13_12645 [Rhodococcus pseudokoreensis]
MTTLEHTKYPVSLYDGADANSIAGFIGTYLGENLEEHPSRIKLAHKLTHSVTIISTDTDSACTIVCGDEEAVVYNGMVGQPPVVLITTDNHIHTIAQLPTKAGGLVPFGLLTNRGMKLLGALVTRRLVVKGLFTDTATVLRLIALLSVSDS